MKKIVWMIALLTLAVMVIAACGGGGSEEPAPQTGVSASAGDAANGEKLFEATCIACHGEGGIGVQGLGKDMTTSEFIAGLSDEELVTFIKVGRDPGDPLNTTGVAMPPKGGNPALSEENLLDIVAYIRTIHKQ